MSHLRELYRTHKKLWQGFLRLSEVADFVAIERPEFLRKRALYSTFVEACSVG